MSETTEGVDLDALQPIKVRMRTYRVLKTLASWKGMSIVDYIEELLEKAGAADLRKVAEELTELAKRKK